MIENILDKNTYQTKISKKRKRSSSLLEGDNQEIDDSLEEENVQPDSDLNQKYLATQHNINVNTTNQTNTNSNKSMNTSQRLRLIEPFRSIGLIIDYNPVAYFKRGNDRFILASNFHSFLTYNLEKLRIERISPPLSQTITCQVPYKNKIFTAVGDKILYWDKIHIIREYYEDSINNTKSDITYKKLITFENLLIAHNNFGSLLMFDIYSSKVVKKLDLNIDLFIHPFTYLNKILFTRRLEKYEEDLNIGGNKIVLYNINTEKQIFEYEFTQIKNGKIKVIEQSPVIDVVAIGFSSGDIIIFNLKSFKTLIHFKSENAVEHITFSNCANLNISLLATAGSNGVINLWDLNKNTLHYSITNTLSNFKSISSICFLPNEPILLATSGYDNSIKMFKIDLNTGTPSILKQRSGHSSNPEKIRFYGDNVNNESNHILSLTKKDLRNLSLLNEHISKELSIKNIPKEIKHEISNEIKIMDFDFNEFRERDWSNVLANIKNSPHPLLFSYENSTITSTLPQIKSKSNCTSVCVSMCGNFGFAGFENGNIEKFNMQSGMNRWLIEKAHDNKPVIALKSDGINSILVSISLDSKLRFWDIYQSTLLKTVELSHTPEKLEINRDNDLVAVGLFNGVIQVYDKSTFKLVREFDTKMVSGNNRDTDSYNIKKFSKINDLTFSKDGKWLISVSDDKSLKIFDILSGNIIEWVEFKHIPVSVTISPNNQYIAISFVGLNGVYLWINRSLFIDFVDFEDVKEPILFNLPFYSHLRKIKTRKEIAEEEKEKNEILSKLKDEKINIDEEKFMSDENAHLIQLSKENKLKFRILNNLEKIQERNEPIVKKKEQAKTPFFLFNINNPDNSGESNEKNSEFLKILKNYSHFKNEKMVNKGEAKKDFLLDDLLRQYHLEKVLSNEITQFMNYLNPYIIDLEIRSIDPIMTFSNELLCYFLDYILEEIESKSNFELVQAYLNRFLKVNNY